MFVLIGEGYTLEQTYYDEPFHKCWFEDQIALFDCKKEAKSWAESFRLKVERKNTWTAPTVFRKKSPMGQYVSYRIEEYGLEKLPINPHLDNADG